ncbi:MAG: hypothetical protein WDO73_14210 [Ignavibacteriota bacterium]
MSIHETAVNPASSRAERIASSDNRKLISGPRAHGTGNINGALLPGDHVVDREESAEPEHPVNALVESGPVRDIHGDMLGPCILEAFVSKGQAERVLLNEAGPVRQSDA